MGMSKFTQEIKSEIAEKYKKERMLFCCAKNMASAEVIYTGLSS